MGDILKVWDEGNSIWIPIPAIQGAQGPQGPKGDKGDSGEFLPLNAYPVGAFYISAVQTSPAELFGGDWERVTGRFLLAATDVEWYFANGAVQPAGTTGGEAEHLLTAAESGVPAHTHPVKSNVSQSYQSGSNKNGYNAGGSNPGNLSPGCQNNTAKDAAQAHNNMPPYLAVYMWKRTA